MQAHSEFVFAFFTFRVSSLILLA